MHWKRDGGLLTPLAAAAASSFGSSLLEMSLRLLCSTPGQLCESP